MVHGITKYFDLRRRHNFRKSDSDFKPPYLAKESDEVKRHDSKRWLKRHGSNKEGLIKAGENN